MPRTAPSTPSTPSSPDGPHGGNAPSADCSTVKCIALTFDDGPGPYTAQLLDTLEQANIPATFFVVGERAAEYPQLVRRAAAEGHEIGNHTWDHKDLSKLDEAGIRAEIERSADAIAAAGAPRPALLRPPYGAVNDQVRSLAGGPLIMWRVDPEDWKYRDAAKVADAIVGAAKTGRIVLSHDIQKTTVEAMPDVIARLRAQGYVFVTVSTLMDGANMKDGRSYFNRPPALDPPVSPTSPSTGDSPSDPNTTPSTTGEAPVIAKI
jgi:peptidoglycan/xylan/chitin deacetylase (PgdA/CDA1 family)